MGPNLSRPTKALKVRAFLFVIKLDGMGVEPNFEKPATLRVKLRLRLAGPRGPQLGPLPINI